MSRPEQRRQADAGRADVRVRASVVCVWAGRVLTVRAVDPVSQRAYLFLPGGAVEAGESAVAAGEREALEETGYALRADPTSALTRDYTFDWAGRPWACRTTFLRATVLNPATPPKPVVDADYLHGIEWVEVTRATDTFAYHPVVAEAVRLLLSGG